MGTSPIFSRIKKILAKPVGSVAGILAKSTALKPRSVLGGLVWDIRAWIRGYRSDTPLRDQVLTLLVFLFGATVSGIGYLTLDTVARTKAQQEFEGPAVQFSDLLRESADRHAATLVDLAILFTDEGATVDRWRFFEYAQEVLPDHGGIESLQWIPRIPREQRRSFEARAREDGLFDFAITEAEPKGGRAAAGDRPFYLPVFYVEPFQGHEVLLGRDLAADPAALALLTRARDAGAPVAGPHVGRAGSENDGAARFDIVVPIYSSAAVPLTIEERRQRIAGFLRGTFRYDGLTDSVMPGITGLPGLRVYIFETAEGSDGRLLYRQGETAAEAREDSLGVSEVAQGLFIAAGHRVAGWRWTIVVKPAKRFLNGGLTGGSLGFVAFVLLLTTLFVFYLVSTQTRTRAIERSVAERTAELESEIAERKRIENELRASKDQAESANRAKSEFLAMMSHELRTPLNAVIGFAEVMSREYFGPLGNEQYRRYSEDIHESGRHLLSLINDILDLSKIEAKRYDLHYEDFSLYDVWQAVKSMMQENFAGTGLDLIDEVPASLPLLRADVRAIRQILLNLLSNAVKFTPDGGSITVAARVDEARRLTIAITDTGIGISPADIQKVLQPFKQVDSSLARKYEGTGLGLPLTKRLVEMHGGQLDLTSDLGVGTAVILSFGPEVLADPSEDLPGAAPLASPSGGAQPGQAWQAGDYASPGRRTVA